MTISESRLLKQIFSLFALVRVQNIILLSIAFILTAKYIFVPEKSFCQLLKNPNFDILLIASAISIASGYIINSFYDYNKDLINRPEKTLIEHRLDQKKRLYLYFFLNFSAVILSLFISWRAALFFSVYIFFIWFYSHKIQHYALWGNILYAILSIFPFFAIFLYFKKFNTFIFWHAIFLFLLLLNKNIVKNFVNLKGDLAQGHQTLPVKYGDNKAKLILLSFSFLQLIPIFILKNYEMLGNMKYYFLVFVLLYYPALFLFYRTKKIHRYNKFYNLMKFLLVLGVFGIALVHQ